MNDISLIWDAGREDIVMLLDDGGDLILDSDSAVIVTYKEYEGEYTVVPILYNDQVLPTQKRLMMEDLTVKAIPIVQTTNPHGGQTVVIG